MLVARLPWHVPWPTARVQQGAEGQVQELGHALAEAQKAGVAAAVEAVQTQGQCDVVKVT